MTNLMNDRVNSLRSALYETVRQANGDLKDQAVLRDSQTLDAAIYQAMIHSAQSKRKAQP